MQLPSRIFTVIILGALVGTISADRRFTFGEPALPTKPNTPWKDGKHPTINSIDGVDAPPAPFLAAEEELKTFHLPPGLQMQLVAAEPMVEVPVVMNFDAAGRLWVAEMIGYMRDATGTGENQPTGRIAVLEDTDGDGRMDKRTVFADKLVLPRAVLPVYDGVLVASPPKLWFMRDTNGDGVWDFRIEVANDYGRRTDNPEHSANGLLWGADNWIHSADYDRAYKRVDGKWISRPEPVRGQWGLTQDDWGRTFHNNNSDYFRGDLVPVEYNGRNRNGPATLAGVNVAIDTNQEVFSGRVNFATNRAYLDGGLRPDGTLKNVTAACSPMIYRGGLLGKEFDGNCFVCEPAVNLVRRSVIRENGNVLTGENAYKAEHKEFLWSDDERFRPVDLKTGLDGAIYIVDMYRGLLEHRGFLTPYLKQLLLNRGMDKPFETGRIWRIVPAGKAMKQAPKLAAQKPAQWVELLSHPNRIVRDTAQRLLVERADSSVTGALLNAAQSARDPRARVAGLWTLQSTAPKQTEALTGAMSDPEVHVRAAAILIAEPLLANKPDEKMLSVMLSLAKDPAPVVRLQFGFTVSSINDPRAMESLAQMLSIGDIDNLIRDASISGLQGREWDLLKRLLDDPEWQSKRPGHGELLAALAACVLREGNPERVAKLLDLCAAESAKGSDKQWRGDVMLGGLRVAITQPRGRKVKNVKLGAEPAVLAAIKDSSDRDLKGTAPALESVLAWPGKPVPAPKPLLPLTGEQEARLRTGKQIYLQICAACHQPDGEGLEGKAPPLAGSAWVTGSEQRLTRIVLHGARGQINVNGETFLGEMPNLSTLNDEQIASVLTYIRRDWDNASPAVDPASIEKIRIETKERTNPWAEPELLKIP